MITFQQRIDLVVLAVTEALKDLQLRLDQNEILKPQEIEDLNAMNKGLQELRLAMIHHDLRLGVSGKEIAEKFEITASRVSQIKYDLQPTDPTAARLRQISHGDVIFVQAKDEPDKIMFGMAKHRTKHKWKVSWINATDTSTVDPISGICRRYGVEYKLVIVDDAQEYSTRDYHASIMKARTILGLM